MERRGWWWLIDFCGDLIDLFIYLSFKGDVKGEKEVLVIKYKCEGEEKFNLEME